MLHFHCHLKLIASYERVDTLPVSHFAWLTVIAVAHACAGVIGGLTSIVVQSGVNSRVSHPQKLLLLPTPAHARAAY